MIPRFLLILPLVSTMALANAAPEVTAEEFERLHKEIRPHPGESRWAEIHWMYDLGKARQKAAEDGKPLCVWRMAGDPTGAC